MLMFKRSQKNTWIYSKQFVLLSTIWLKDSLLFYDFKISSFSLDFQDNYCNSEKKKKQVYFCSCQVNASHFHTLNFVSLLILITLLWKALKSPAQNNTEQVKSSCVAEQLHSSINSKTDEVVRSSRKTFLWALKNITEVRWIGHFCAWKKKKTYLKILFFRFSLWEFYYKCLNK